MENLESRRAASHADQNEVYGPVLGPLLLRLVAALLFITPVFLSVGYYLVARAAAGALQDPVPAAQALWDANAYDRLYETPVFDQAFAPVLPHLTGGFAMEDEARTRLVREILPPQELQAVAQGALTAYASFIGSQRDTGALRLEADLSPAMARARPAVARFVSERVEAMPVRDYAPSASEDIARVLAAVHTGDLLALPDSVALRGATPQQLREAYQAGVASFASTVSVSPEVIQGLVSGDDLREALDRGQHREALAYASGVLAEHRTEEQLSELRGQLLNGTHLDLISSLRGSEQPIDVAADAQELQFWTWLTVDLLRWAALGIAIVLAIAVGLVMRPYWRHVFVWPGILLSLIGVAVLLPDAALNWLTGITLAPCGSSCSVFPDVTGELAKAAANDPTPQGLLLIAPGFAAIALAAVIRAPSPAHATVAQHLSATSVPRRRLGLAQELSPRSKLTLFVLISLFLALLTVAVLPFLLRARSWAYVAAFILSLLSSATVVIPAPGFPAVILMASRFDPIWLGIAAGIGGTLGELTGYWMGRQGKQSLQDNRGVRFLERAMARYGGWMLSVAVLLPVIPVDVAGVIAGTARYPLHKFLLYLAIAKTATSIAVLYLAARAFDWAEPYLDLFG